MATPQTHPLTTFHYDALNSTFIQRTAPRALGPTEVLIRTTHSGICFTDVHAKAKGCGLGHEGVGVVQALGEGVTGGLKVGQRVGWGWLHSSCNHCPACATGHRQYCADACGFAFGELDQGAFGDAAIRDQAFVYPIPDAVESRHAAPFMCAGASVYEALDAAGTKPADRVGVVGVGGLGHMAILFATAMGCAVTALSSTHSKSHDALALGADTFVPLSDLGGRSAPPPGSAAAINVLLLCTNELPDLEPIMPLLARRATIVPMTIAAKPMVVPFMPFMLPGHRIIASTEASRRNHLAMMQFAARHRIRPWIEEFPMTAGGVAAAFGRLEAGEMRYRGVLVREGG